MTMGVKEVKDEKADKMKSEMETHGNNGFWMEKTPELKEIL
jgi:hypothetical protein